MPPVVVADHPDAAWSWDITDLPGEFVGQRYKAYVVTDVFDAHGVVESHSRPRVSNDNPYSEAVFATVKTHASYPGIFTSLDLARAWCASWIESYNTTHLHSGIGFYSPDEIAQPNRWH